MSGVVVWFTGLPASGKTTLADRVRKRLESAACRVASLDSDALRPILAPDRGYRADDRDAFYLELGQLAAKLARDGEVVLVSATAPRRAHRDAARAIAPHFVEVHVDVPRAECEARDPKGLYVRARAGEAPDLPGLGVDYEPPENPTVVAHGGLDTEAAEAVARLAQAAAAG